MEQTNQTNQTNQTDIKIKPLSQYIARIFGCIMLIVATLIAKNGIDDATKNELIVISQTSAPLIAAIISFVIDEKLRRKQK